MVAGGLQEARVPEGPQGKGGVLAVKAVEMQRKAVSWPEKQWQCEVKAVSYEIHGAARYIACMQRSRGERQ